jgi:hypothetical protein
VTNVATISTTPTRDDYLARLDAIAATLRSGVEIDNGLRVALRRGITWIEREIARAAPTLNLRDELIRVCAAQFYADTESARQLARVLAYDLLYRSRPKWGRSFEAGRRKDWLLALDAIRRQCGERSLSEGQLRNILGGARTPKAQKSLANFSRPIAVEISQRDRLKSAAPKKSTKLRSGAL